MSNVFRAARRLSEKSPFVRRNATTGRAYASEIEAIVSSGWMKWSTSGASASNVARVLESMGGSMGPRPEYEGGGSSLCIGDARVAWAGRGDGGGEYSGGSTSP